MKERFICRTCIKIGILCFSVIFFMSTPNIWAGAVPGDSPSTVPGKEYSDHLDKDMNAVADPEQNLNWDTLPVTDTFDYSGSRTGDDNENREVDGLANGGDALYYSVINNNADLLFSVDSDPNIYFEHIVGVSGLWATPPMIDSNGVNDLDGLEVWGAFNSDDANRYSLEGDPAVAVGASRVSVWSYVNSTNTSNALHYTDTLASLIGLDDSYWDLFDLDAMMTSGNSIMFSIGPIIKPTDGSILFDGGEIWVWDGSSSTAGFLNHGGHLWNTAFDVAGTFGLNSENINALEAVGYAEPVPEPATMLLLGSGLIGLVGLGRRRFFKK